jgi:hypothetical protein
MREDIGRYANRTCPLKVFAVAPHRVARAVKSIAYCGKPCLPCGSSPFSIFAPAAPLGSGHRADSAGGFRRPCREIRQREPATGRLRVGGGRAAVRGSASSAWRTFESHVPSEPGTAIAQREIHTEHRGCAPHRGCDWLRLVGPAHPSMSPRAGHAHGNWHYPRLKRPTARSYSFHASSRRPTDQRPRPCRTGRTHLEQRCLRV